jgi:hypothetical protein
MVDYNITFTSGPSTSSMTFFNSINASTTLGTTQSVIKYQVTAINNANQIAVHFSDIISLNTNDTIQLAGASALTTSAVVYNFISCNIRGLLN